MNSKGCSFNLKQDCNLGKRNQAGVYGKKNSSKKQITEVNTVNKALTIYVITK